MSRDYIAAADVPEAIALSLRSIEDALDAIADTLDGIADRMAFRDATERRTAISAGRTEIERIFRDEIYTGADVRFVNPSTDTEEET